MPHIYPRLETHSLIPQVSFYSEGDLYHGHAPSEEDEEWLQPSPNQLGDSTIMLQMRMEHLETLETELNATASARPKKRKAPQASHSDEDSDSPVRQNKKPLTVCNFNSLLNRGS